MPWEYRILNVTVVDRWSSKAQQREIDAFQGRLNEAGADGWEMVGFEAIPLTGSFSSNIKGYAYLCFFKRQMEGSSLKEQQDTNRWLAHIAGAIKAGSQASST
jgi:hypothetical protein